MSGLDLIARGLAQRATTAAFRPANRNVAFVGDSITYNNWAGGTTTQMGRGPSFWMQVFSACAARAPGEYNFGTSGATAPAITLTNAALAAATPAGVVVHLAGTNDRGASLTTADTTAALQAAVALYLAAGKGVILVVPFPRSSPSALSGTQLAYHVAVRRWILQTYHADPRVRIVDIWPAWALADGSCASGKLVDGLHPGPAGALELGQLYAAAFDGWFQPATLLATSNTDVWSSANPGGNLLANGMMTATGGSLAGTPAPTGSVAGYCTLDSLNSTGVAVAGAKIVSGYGELQQIAVSGTPTTATPAVQVRQSVTTLSAIQTGDVLEGLLAVEVDAGQTGLRGLRADLAVADSGGSRFARSGEADTGTYPATAWKGVIRTPRLTVGTGLTVTSLSFYLLLTQGVAASATVRTGRWMLRKVT